jgi:nicotinamide riboside transporter PnuC
MNHLGYIAMVLAMVGTYVNAKGNRLCFVIWSVSNVVFCGLSVINKDWPQAGLFAFNLAMCVKGWRCWAK